MRLTIIRSCAAILLAFTCVTNAYAKSAFYVQLGTAANQDDAEKKWKRLKKEYPALLSGMSLSARSVSAEAGGASEVRVQAGPARSRDTAQHICTTLSESGKECFIVETAVFDGEPSIPRSTITTSVNSPAPVEDAPDTQEMASAEAKETSPNAKSIGGARKSGGWFGWLFGDDEDASPSPQEETKLADKVPDAAPELPATPAPIAADSAAPATPADAPAPVSASEAEMADARAGELPWQSAPNTTTAERVDVAEAIPLESPPPITAAPLNTGMSDGAGMGAATPAPAMVDTSVPEAVRWLQISGFGSEQKAYDFSEKLHLSLQDGGSLRMRVNRPLFARASNRAVTLTVGPVSDKAIVEKICALATESETPLVCGGSAERSEVASNLMDRTKQDAPAPAPLAPAPMMPETPAPRGDISSPAAPQAESMETPAERFYVQLGSWKDEAEATRRWEILKEAHPELSSYTPEFRQPARVSLGARASIRLRVGPFTVRSEAEKLCSSLAAKRASCIVVPE